jgi:2,3-bisphosphoglycerate-independent phosphoglycerate mutase
MLREKVSQVGGVDVFWESEKEHRVVLIMRGAGLSAELTDTDPQQTGVPPLPLPPRRRKASARSGRGDGAGAGARGAGGRAGANGLLARGFATFERYPSMEERYGLRAVCIARYPMYRGVSRLLGMDIAEPAETDAGSIDVLAEQLETTTSPSSTSSTSTAAARTATSTRRWRPSRRWTP